jgi:hypothetical protein
MTLIHRQHHHINPVKVRLTDDQLSTLESLAHAIGLAPAVMARELLEEAMHRLEALNQQKRAA